MEKRDFKEVMEMANNYNGSEQYFFFGEKPLDYRLTYGDDVISVFDAMNYHHGDRVISFGGEKFYKLSSKIDENGNTLKKGVYRDTLYHHRAYGKIDKVVTGVSFDIVGFKRKTTHLPAGVLVSNVNFVW